MIKTIKKIDIQGNEIWQEVYVCNRCKRILGEDEYVYTTKWKSYFPVKPNGLVACGFGESSNPDIHICENCSNDVQRFWNGEYSNEHAKAKQPLLYTFDKQVQMMASRLRGESTPALKEYRDSFMCTRESAAAIDLILKERELK